MASKTVPPPQVAYQGTDEESSSAFPEDLPPRPQQSTEKSGLQRLLTFNFLRSYSLRGLPNARMRWRRVAMMLILFLALAMAATDLAFMYWIPLIVIFAVVDAIVLWALGFSLAVIGDAVGNRKLLGTWVGPKFFDGFLIFLVIFYPGFFVIGLLVVGFEAFQGLWILLAMLIFAVAWLASEPPYTPEGRV